MQEIIPLSSAEIGGETRRAVDAREIHAFLCVKSEFRHWIKNRIEQFGFLEGVDFVAGIFLPGSERVDYFVTLDMAKELSMVERTQKGKEARQYFIECERVAKEAVSAPIAAPIAVPEQAAASALDGTLRAAAILGVPLHLAQIESVKAVRLAHRVDFSPLLTHAPAQSDVPELEIMLEPTELAERLGVGSARQMNAILRDAGLQSKDHGEWRPTERGKPMCSRHAWSRGEKSGYNLKWRLAPVRKALAPKLVTKSA